eukprot:TRINITY_DN821_c0_g1_i2.p1 TRINITY_DN821_c0_g1~~TRINITY_DN821_c0_g1_i2.p1  ORF type:complete len:107 (-),score=29.83 TRINITY_DN821_c0_g1_i2:56-376(-)
MSGMMLVAIPEMEEIQEFVDTKTTVDPVLLRDLELIHIRIELHYQRKMERQRRLAEQVANKIQSSTPSESSGAQSNYQDGRNNENKKDIHQGTSQAKRTRLLFKFF